MPKSLQLEPYKCEYIKNHYQSQSAKEISLALSIRIQDVYNFVNKSKIKKLGKVGKYNVDITKFVNITEPEMAYFLGFFWADGYIWRDTKSKSKILMLHFLTEDYLTIKEPLHKIVDWDVRFENIKNRNPSSFLSFRGFDIADFLTSFDYIDRTMKSPERIINHIPENIRHYWFRGYLDGDGFISQNRTKITFSSGFHQNWNFMIRLCESLNIQKFTINHSINKLGHKNSLFYMSDLESCCRLIKYIYKDYDVLKIGLDRKYNNTKQILQRFSKREQPRLISEKVLKF
jgi:hypothetical protein